MSKSVHELAREGKTIPEMAEELGVSQGTVRRRLREASPEARAGLAEGPRDPGGRPAVVEQLTPEQVDNLQELRAMTASDSAAVQLWTRVGNCPEPVREHLRKAKSKHNIPRSLRRAMNVTPEVAKAIQGKKALDQGFIIGRMDLSDCAPGDWWELDDMSINHPFWFEIAGEESEIGERSSEIGGRGFTRNGTSDRLAARQGIMVGRQGLYACDRKSGYWLGAKLLGRPKDAYKAADILRFLRQLMEDYGKPHKGLILERGIWQSRAIDGVKLTEEGKALCEELTTGLRDMGLEIRHAFNSRGKAFIESAFDPLQTYQRGLFKTLYMGRTRGEMEREAALVRSLRSGAKTPEQAGIWHITAATEGVLHSLQLHNDIVREGEHQRGVPREIFEKALMATPVRGLSKRDLGLLLPDRHETRIRGLMVEKKHAGSRFRWCAPEKFAELGNDYRVLARFDLDAPELGAAIYNLETGSRNSHGLRLGEFIDWAAPEGDAAHFGDLRKRARRAFVSTYGSLLDRVRLDPKRAAVAPVAAQDVGRRVLDVTGPAGRVELEQSTDRLPVPERATRPAGMDDAPAHTNRLARRPSAEDLAAAAAHEEAEAAKYF